MSVLHIGKVFETNNSSKTFRQTHRFEWKGKQHLLIITFSNRHYLSFQLWAQKGRRTMNPL